MISLATRLQVTKAIFTSSISPSLDSQVLVRASPSVIQIDWHNSQLSLIFCFMSLRHFRFWRKTCFFMYVFTSLCHPLWHRTCFKGLVFLVKVLIWTFKKFDTADDSFTKAQGVISSHFTASESPGGGQRFLRRCSRRSKVYPKHNYNKTVSKSSTFCNYALTCSGPEKPQCPLHLACFPGDEMLTLFPCNTHIVCILSGAGDFTLTLRTITVGSFP